MCGVNKLCVTCECIILQRGLRVKHFLIRACVMCMCVSCSVMCK